MHPAQLSEPLQSVVDLNAMLLSVCFEELFPLEARVDLPSFLLLSDLLSLKSLVLDDNGLVLPGPPDLVLDFFLLFGGLFDGGQDASLSSGDLNELVLLGLLYDHLSPSLFALVLFLLALSACKTALFPTLCWSQIDGLRLLFDCRH